MVIHGRAGGHGPVSILPKVALAPSSLPSGWLVAVVLLIRILLVEVGRDDTTTEPRLGLRLRRAYHFGGRLFVAEEKLLGEGVETDLLMHLCLIVAAAPQRAVVVG